MPEFDTWFPTSRHGTPALNVMDFGALGDGSGATVGAAIDDYPSAEDAGDTKDWAAITECFKQAFRHETSPGVWVPNGSEASRNKPVVFPPGVYITYKPIELTSIEGALVSGVGGGGGVLIYNIGGIAPDNICIAANGVKFTRFENMAFRATGAGSIAFDMNWDNGLASSVSSNGNLWTNCDFGALAGVGIAIGSSSVSPLPGGGAMSSEMHFIKCNFNNCTTGIVIDNFNALNYHFLGCGGTDCTKHWLRVVTGGFVVLQNGSWANNATDADGFEISIGGGTCVIIGSRTESKRFVDAGGPTTLIACDQNYYGYDNVFVNAVAPVNITNCHSYMGRLCGYGEIHVDSSTRFNDAYATITGVSSGTGGVVRITHNLMGGIEYFSEGDEVQVKGLTSTGAGAAAVNGIWNIHKISGTQVELLNSSYVADTYTTTGASIWPGPRFHLRDIVTPGGRPLSMKLVGGPSRTPQQSRTKGLQLLWADSGTAFDNLGATGEVIITLPSLYNDMHFQPVRGSYFTFIVLAGQNLKIQVDTTPHSGTSSRIFRAGAYASAGTSIASNVIGNSITIWQADASLSSEDDRIAHRWLVRSETGTWTIAGTPAGTARAAEEAKIRSRYSAPSRRLPQAREPV